MPMLSEVQASQSLALTEAFKARRNRTAGQVAALIALYYQQRVDPGSVESVEEWLAILIPRLIASNDSGAREAARFFEALRQIEVGVNAQSYSAQAALGTVDGGVRKSLLTVGPYAYQNKMREIERLDVSPQKSKALILEAKKATTKSIAAAAYRHAQTGSRQTIFANAAQDRTALGTVRVTRANPCAFCAMLASRGVTYRPFSEDSFDLSNARFTGDGNAKVHDSCGCAMKTVYSEDDPVLARNKKYVDLWETWGAGGGDAALRFRRGYDHLRKTGEHLTWEEANEGLRSA